MNDESFINESKEEYLIEDESNRGSIVELGRISENTQEKIEAEGKKVSSYQTVFSIWNIMIGSNIVSIPYNVYLAGIVPAIFIVLLMALFVIILAAYTLK